jgi:hypothetical protein
MPIVYDTTKNPRVKVGEVKFPSGDLVDLDINTQDSHLRDILLAAVTSPIPGYTRGEDGLAPHLTGDSITVGDEAYEDSLAEYLAGYGYTLE